MIKVQDTSIDPMGTYLISAGKMWYGCLRENEVKLNLEFEMYKFIAST